MVVVAKEDGELKGDGRKIQAAEAAIIEPSWMITQIPEVQDWWVPRYQHFQHLLKIKWQKWGTKGPPRKKTKPAPKGFVSEGISFCLEYTSNLTTFFKLFAKQKVLRLDVVT